MRLTLQELEGSQSESAQESQKLTDKIADQRSVAAALEAEAASAREHIQELQQLRTALEGDRLLVVLNYENTQLGIFVDAVDQMIEIPLDALHPMPAQNSQILVSEMCTIPDGSGTMLVLDCEQLFAHD